MTLLPILPSIGVLRIPGVATPSECRPIIDEIRWSISERVFFSKNTISNERLSLK